MTKIEFDNIFNEKFNENVSLFRDKEKLKEKMLKHTNGSTTITDDEMAAFILIESINFSKNLVYSIFSEVLQFED